MKDAPEGVKALDVIPLYANLPSHLQMLAFQQSENWKVILATNIAETSVTIDGVKFVIDSGLCKVKTYSPSTGME